MYGKKKARKALCSVRAKLSLNVVNFTFLLLKKKKKNLLNINTYIRNSSFFFCCCCFFSHVVHRMRHSTHGWKRSVLATDTGISAHGATLPAVCVSAPQLSSVSFRVSTSVTQRASSNGCVVKSTRQQEI